VIDAHLHYWQPATAERPHVRTPVDIGPPVSVERLLATTAAAGVDHVVQVTPSCMGFDNRYALEGAERFPERIRVFGRLDPTAPRIVEEIDAWHEHPLTVGVRLTLFRGKRDWAGNDAWTPFWRRCEELGVPVAVYAPEQAAALGALAREHPGLVLLVDHCTLSHAPDTFDRWEDLLALHELPNVVMKVSYFPEATAADGYPFERGQRRLQEVYERFGADRMIWGSNFPPVLTACSYAEALAFVAEECDFLTAEDRDKVLGGTASRLLGLPW
jgi:predicted TIM-barrel fold metal-dependent hydrolase